jgi:hypothetical protein
MAPNQKIALKLIPAPKTGRVVNAPPILSASDHTVDYTCGKCGTVLLHADLGQVHNLLILCTNCGSHNTADE